MARRLPCLGDAHPPSINQRLVIPHRTRLTAAALLLALFVIACSGGDPHGAGTRRGTKPGKPHFTEDPSAAAIKIATISYRPSTSLGAIGSLSGTVTLSGAAPAEPQPSGTDAGACGTPAEPRVQVDGKGDLSNAVVWIENAKTGKPFPIEKRSELSSDNCALDPRVQAVVEGTTVNVFNDDKLIHKLNFHLVGEPDTLTKMWFYTTGQVVASERIAKKPGVVEVRCEQHPWTRGYVLVFDHPYFAVTDTDGSFSIDSLPAGSYRVMVWHEGLAKPLEQTVQIAANGTAKLNLALTLSAAH